MAKGAATSFTYTGNSVSSPSDFPWKQQLPWVRVVLATVAAILAGIAEQRLSATVALLVLYLIASAVGAIRGGGQHGLLGMLALFADTVYFLIVVYFGGDRMTWLAAAFFLYLLTEALVFSGPVEVAVIAAGSSIFCAVLPNPGSVGANQAGAQALESMVVVAGALACGFAVYTKRQKVLTDDLAVKLGAALKAVEKSREDETHRIAADFHDGPLQSFISLQMRLEILRKLLERDADAGMQDLRQLQALAQSQVRDLRTFLHSMRPVDIDGGNLVVTIRRTAESFQKESGIPVAFVGASTPVGLPPEITVEVLQMVREALHNVQKHAGATRVAVSLEKNDRGLEISIDDNGHGFNFAGIYSLEELELLRLGPASLKRRARGLNADMLLESRPGRGAGIKFRIPLQ
jgi:signal transduction histidine kinase